MTDDDLTVGAIAALRGVTVATARAWVAEQVRAGRLEATSRDLDTGAKRYPRTSVLAAIEVMPGQGSRTDLRSRNDDQHDDGDDHSPD